MTGTYLLIRLGEEQYALPVDVVLKAEQRSDPAPLPGAPAAVLGLHNVRGEIVPLLDLAALVGAGVPPDRRDAVVIVEHRGRRAGLAVDALLDVAGLEEQSRRDEHPPLRASVVVRGSMIGVLDVGTLLDAVQREVPA